MKNFLIISIIFICSLFSLNINANGITDNNLNNQNVEEIVVNVPSKVTLYDGENFDIGIRTKDMYLYECIKYQIKNNVLYIDLLDQRYLIDQKLEPNDVKINIQTPKDIKKIRTNSDLLVAEVQKNNATNNEKN